MSDSIIKLYHGSAYEIECPDLSKGREDVDFGCGFYVTPDILMAEKWACRKRTPFINEYELDISKLNVYYFGLDKEWLNFIVQNRGLEENKDFDSSKYDVLVGATADDRLFSAIEQYETGFISENLAIKALNCMKVGIQYVLKNERAVNVLKYVGTKQMDQVRINEIKNIIREERKMANAITEKVIKDGIKKESQENEKQSLRLKRNGKCR